MQPWVAVGLAAIAFAASIHLVPSDFAQDYLAARAVRNHIDPNLPSRNLALRYGVPLRVLTSVQTAHPPLVTALAIPFAIASWPQAELAWQLCLCALTVALMIAAGIKALDLLILAPAWIFGLALGNVDAIIVCLCLLALRPGSSRTGIWLGIATALKVYPALLLLGLIATKRYREAATGISVAAGLTAAATAVIGIEGLTGWLRFIPHNSDSFAVSMMNLSLSKIAALAGLKTVIVIAMVFAAVVLQYGRATLDPLLPAILLVSPLSWLQSLPLLSNRLTQGELALAGACGLIITGSWISGRSWAGNIGAAASFTLTALVIVVYCRLVRNDPSE